VRKLAGEQKLQGQKRLNADGSPEWVFPLKNLEPHLQLRYYKDKAAEMPGLAEFTEALQKQGKPFDYYSESERQEIIFWQQIIEEWQDYRSRPGADLETLDDRFVEYCKIQHPDISISVKTLYRKWKFLKDNNLDGLIDKRGKCRKGKSKITEEMWQTFLSYYLDEAQHPIQKCYEYTLQYFQKMAPELVDDIPSDSTFRRRVERDIPEPMEVLGRQGQKAFRDRCAPYIHRLYEEMASNF